MLQDVRVAATLLYRVAEERGGRLVISWAPQGLQEVLGLALDDWEERDEEGRRTDREGSDQRTLLAALDFLTDCKAASTSEDMGMLFLLIASRPLDEYGGPPPWEEWWYYGKHPLARSLADFVAKVEASLPEALAHPKTETRKQEV